MKPTIHILCPYNYLDVSTALVTWLQGLVHSWINHHTHESPINHPLITYESAMNQPLVTIITHQLTMSLLLLTPIIPYDSTLLTMILPRWTLGSPRPIATQRIPIHQDEAKGFLRQRVAVLPQLRGGRFLGVQSSCLMILNEGNNLG